ncbi:C2 calcium-dependent domain-containing protein 4D-like [Rhinophrynus dorsalis]
MFRSKKKVVNSCPNILTPDQIPKFFIPPKLSPALARGGPSRLCLQKRSSDIGSKPLQKELIRSANHHIIQVEDVEQDTEAQEQNNHLSFHDTLIGSPYLSESPHTRRRESLFHEKCPTHGSCEGTSLSPLDSEYILSWRSSSADLGLHQLTPGTIDSDTTSSADSSPFNSPLLTRSLAGCLVKQVYDKQHLFCRTLSVKTLARENSLSTEEISSTDTSPNVPRRESQCGLGVSMVHLVPPPVFHLDFICCQERLTKETEVTLSKGGLLRLSAEYIKEMGRLRVKLVSVENLYPPHQDPKGISCCAMMCLQPGKVQRQRSTVIRRSRNPIFNEDFFFEGVEKEELEIRSLKVKVINQGSSMRRDHLLGHTEIRLSSILPP